MQQTRISYNLVGFCYLSVSERWSDTK